MNITQDNLKSIKNIRLGFRSLFFNYTWYEFSIVINNIEYNARYFERDDYVTINNEDIKLDDKTKQALKILVGATDENKKTRRNLQLENFLYGQPYGIARLNKEHQDRIFSQLAQVTLDDFLALPKHWHSRVKKPMLVDWLRCSNNENNKDAIEFICSILK